MKEHNKKYNYIYKIINNLNNHYYYGKRSCDCLPEEDEYMGSGTALNKAYLKYGHENFTKKIISLHDSWQDAYEAEAKIVTRKMINSPECYNMKTGGLYNNYIFSEEVKNKISETVKERIKTDSTYRNKILSRLEKARTNNQTPEANKKRSLSLSKPTKYKNGRADKRENRLPYNVWILINDLDKTEIVSYNGIKDLPISKAAVFGRMKYMGIKDRKSEIEIKWTKGKHKHFRVIRMPMVCWL